MQSKLIRALRANAIFSATSAITMVLVADWLAAQLGLPDARSIYAVAGMLIVFALQIGNIVRTNVIRRWEILSIIAADFGWVLGSGILAVIYYAQISIIGLILIDVVAIVVLYLAIQQLAGLREAAARA